MILLAVMLCITLLVIGVIAGGFIYLEQANSATATRAFVDSLRQSATETSVRGFIEMESLTLAADARFELTAAATQTTATALALDTLNAPTSTPTVTGTPPTSTPSPTATRRPGTVVTARTGTITIMECYGHEASIALGQSEFASLHSFATKTYTVPPGTYQLKVNYLDQPGNNVDTPIEVRGGTQVLRIGNLCP